MRVSGAVGWVLITPLSPLTAGGQLIGSDGGRARNQSKSSITEYWRRSVRYCMVVIVRSIPASVKYGTQSPGEIADRHLLVETVHFSVAFSCSISGGPIAPRQTLQRMEPKCAALKYFFSAKPLSSAFTFWRIQNSFSGLQATAVLSRGSR